jgi:hypothetical protein
VRGIIEGYAKEFPYFHRQLAKYSLDEGKYDEAFDHIARFMATENLPKMFDLTSFDAFIDLSRLARADKTLPETHVKAGSAYLLLGSLDDYAKAEREFALAKDCAGEKKEEYALLHALFLSAIRGIEDQKTRDAWVATAKDIMADESLSYEPMSETTNRVYAKGSPFLRGQVLFKEKRSLEDAVMEIETNKMVQNVLEGTGFSTATHVAVIDKPNPVLVMRREEGETLWEKIQRREYSIDDFMAVVPMFARIHARMPYDRLELDPKAKILNRLERMGVKDSIRDGIAQNYDPIVESYHGLPIVYNIDGHPENVLFSGKRIILLDNERRVGVPQVFDLVNLIYYGERPKGIEEEAIIERYRLCFSGESGEDAVDKESFRLGFTNAIIDRSLCFSSSWSTRKAMRAGWPTLIRNAGMAIDRIRVDHPAFYDQFSEEYGALYENIMLLA